MKFQKLFVNTQKIIKLFSIILLFGLFLNFVTPTVIHADATSDYAVVSDASQPSEEDGGIQKIKLNIKSGKSKNSIFDVSFKAPNQNIKRNLQKGDVVFVRITPSQDGKGSDIIIEDFYRLPNIFWAPIIFILILLVVVIVKYKNKILILSSVTIAIILSILMITFLRINSVLVITTFFSLSFFILLYFVYRKLTIAIVGLLLPLILGVFVYLLSLLSLQLAQVQVSYLDVISSFYSFDNPDYYESFYAAVLFGSLIGSVYIAYQQILESIKFKVHEITLSKKELTLRSFKHMIKNLDTMLLPAIGIFLGILFSIFIFLQRTIGIQNALNSDYLVSLSIVFSICFIAWIITVPICALLCGVILGRLEKHKIVTDKTITILD